MVLLQIFKQPANGEYLFLYTYIVYMIWGIIEVYLKIGYMLQMSRGLYLVHTAIDGVFLPRSPVP